MSPTFETASLEIGNQYRLSAYLTVMGRTAHVVAAALAAGLSIVATVAMTRALLGDGELATLFVVPKENAGAFVAVLACVMFVPPVFGLASVEMAWRARVPAPRLFPGSMALLQLLGAWWLGETAPRGWLLAAAAAFSVAALIAPKVAEPTLARAPRTWWRTSLGIAALLSSIAVAGARAAPFFTGADVSAVLGKDDISLLLGQVFLVPTVALVLLRVDGVRLDPSESAVSLRVMAVVAAVIQLYALKAPFAAPLRLSVLSASLFAAMAVSGATLHARRRAAEAAAPRRLSAPP